jgi:hypothetical protein
MSLIDKFQIIENHVDSKNIDSKLENYFENYINNNIKITFTNYINMLSWFNNINIPKVEVYLTKILTQHLTERRNNMRSFIKKSDFEFEKLNSFILEYISKLQYLDRQIFRDENNKLLNMGIEKLTQFIIFDSFILNYLEQEITLLSNNNLSNIKTLFLTLQNISKTTYDKLLLTFSNIFKKNVIITEKLPIPENIKRINTLNNSIQYCKNILKYFNFINMDDTNKLISNSIDVVAENFIIILKNNSISEIDFVFNNTTIWSDLNTLIFNNMHDIHYNNKGYKIKKTINKNKFNCVDIINNEIISLFDMVLLADINDIFKFFNIYKKLQSSINNIETKTIIITKFAKILSDDNVIDKILSHINMLILYKDINSVDNILSFMFNIKNQDVFISKYYQYLIKRLMNYVSKNNNILDHINIEDTIYHKLKTIFNENLLYNIFKVIRDTILSYNINARFKKLNNTSVLSVIITSYNNWDVNQNEGVVSSKILSKISNTIMGKYLLQYDNFYSEYYGFEKILNWFPHFGEVDISYMNQDLKLLPIQFMILEMFDKTNNIKLSDIIKSEIFINYSNKFISDCINSLVAGGLLKQNNDMLTLMESGIFKNNLIEIFFNISDYSNVWEEKRTIELMHNREDILKTNINSIIKKKSMNKNELFQKLKDNIKVFELDMVLFDKTLDSMIKMDYIKLKDGMYIKLFY